MKSAQIYAPPHCPYWLASGPVALLVGLATGVLAGAEVGGTVGAMVGDETGGAGAAAPEPMAVVMGPFSMNTPLMYQSSGAGVLTMRSTPTWKSSEFVEVDAGMLAATLTSGSPPVEAQRPTVPAEN